MGDVYVERCVSDVLEVVRASVWRALLDGVRPLDCSFVCLLHWLSCVTEVESEDRSALFQSLSFGERWLADTVFSFLVARPLRRMIIDAPNKIAAGNRHRAFSFDGTMKFEHHPCSQAQSPVAVPELWR